MRKQQRAAPVAGLPRQFSVACNVTLRGAVTVQQENISSEISSVPAISIQGPYLRQHNCLFSPFSAQNSPSRLKKITAYCLFISVRKTLKVLYDICANIYIYSPRLHMQTS